MSDQLAGVYIMQNTLGDVYGENEGVVKKKLGKTGTIFIFKVRNMG